MSQTMDTFLGKQLQQWRDGVALIYAAIGEPEPAGLCCATLAEKVLALRAENERVRDANAITRDAARYRAIRDCQRLSWGVGSRGMECVIVELPLAGEPIWKNENNFDFEANLDAAADKLVDRRLAEAAR